MSSSEEYTEDDCPNDSLLSRAFHIGQSQEFGDPNVPPTSGNEYLRRVQEEYRQCPKVVVANIDTSKFLANRNVKIDQTSCCLPAPEGFASTIQWQKTQIVFFSELRRKISIYKSNAKSFGGRINKSKIILPKIDDDVGWCRLCFGSSKKTNQNGELIKTDETSKKMNSSTTFEGAADAPPPPPPPPPPMGGEGTLPYASLVFSLSQPVLEQVLTYHVSWMEVTGFSAEQGRWFYSLLACLEKPLTPEACSSLRSLARACATLRATLTSKEDLNLIPLNLLITLVSRYFDQKDLADSN